MKKKLFLIITLIALPNLIIGQKSSEELNQYKQFLPYVIKDIQENKTQKKSPHIESKIGKKFNKPWDVEKLDKETIKKTINTLIDNHTLHVEQDYRKKWNLDFHSTLNLNSAIEETSNTDNLLSNIIVSISNIELLDRNRIPVIETEERKVKINQDTELSFHSAGINIEFPLQKKYDTINGTISLTLVEYQKISYKEFRENDKNKSFNLGDFKGLKLLKIQQDKAYVYLPKLDENIKISGTSKTGEEYIGGNFNINIPKSVYDYAIGDNITEKLTKSLIDNLTIKDFKEEPQILIYKTSGIIENLFIYLKSSPKNLTSKTLNIKL
ncbi:hypothetical protein CXF68_12405 [Tenacibaculum sp. Bg11-29]|uniref:hypothetical protein n=1 Tax=Tenacibaculum sp. Bg11-29 TaxID=2058306 RepID=UPI000C334445|nr:hypothetical protein [Tenacibaculum sp. Bg11-29]PKH51434.1 hypothetical protein CXF68_12405 [Tenacibaculum sp. Bg11-29]